MLEVALFEVLQALDIYCGPLAEYWSWTPPCADLQKKMHHKNILLTIARQLSQAQKNELRKLLSFVRTWVEARVQGDPHECRYQMERRMLLIGILFDSNSVVASIAFESLEHCFTAQTSNSEHVNEELIYSALRLKKNYRESFRYSICSGEH